MHRHRISLLSSTRTPIRSPNGILRGRRQLIRQEWGKPLRPASTERPGEQKPPPEGSKGLPPREQRSPRWEQRSPYRGAKVSPMGFKVCSRAAKVSPEGSKGLPLKEAKFSTSLAKVSPKGILLHRHRISPLPSIRTPIRAPNHTLEGAEAESHGRNGVRSPY